MKILITGSTGFIGRHLCRHYSPNHEVLGLSRKFLDSSKKLESTHYVCDLSQREQVERLFEDCQPDVIIHCAAVATPSLALQDPLTMWNCNTAAVVNLSTLAPKGTTVINLSSVVVYGRFNPRYAINEFAKAEPISFYGVTKLSSEYLWEISPQNLNVINLRPSAVIGRGSTHGIIHDFLKKRLLDKFEVLGSAPGSIKPYLHIEDLISAVDMGVNGKLTHGAYNVCPNDNISVQDIAKMFTGKEPIWSGSSFTGDNPVILCSSAKLMTYGWNMKYPTSRSAIQGVLDEYN